VSVLTVKRVIAAAPERLFDAWTRPEELRCWWGPAGVTCTAADVDLRVGGTYRIANQFPEGRVVWIEGRYERIERPSLLIYTWRLAGESAPAERVRVSFRPHPQGTEVIVRHERIRDTARRDGHERGWLGCLEGLERHVAPRV
jgi:uncharacterized protein YndB with AHSA1/START domain